MTAGKYDIYIEQGATFELNITIDGSIDLTQYTARGQIRKSATDTTVVYDFTCTVVSATQLKVSLTATQTTALVTTGKNYSEVTLAYYDVEIEKTSDHSVIRLLNGAVKISPEITK